MGLETEARALTLFERSLEVPKAQRQDWLDERIGQDAALREELRQLVEADKSHDEILVPPIEAGQFLAAGAILSGWKIIKAIGEGGMGMVYLAERSNRDFKQLGALKVMRRLLLNPDQDSRVHLVKRFETERQILARINHDGIAKVLDGGTTAENVPFLVMEYVDGEPIDQYCQKHKLDLRSRLVLIQQILAAIAVVHRNLFVHRDIKPSNILVNEEGHPKLLDFGIAKVLEERPGLTAMQTATRMGAMTPQYASPEQVAGEAVTTASDIYSTGLLAFELLTGARAYDLTTATPAEAEKLIRHTVPALPSQAAQRRGARGPVKPNQLKGDLDQIIMKALSKEPERRYDSASEMAADIDRYLNGLPVAAQANHWWYRAGKFIQRHRTGVVATAIALAALLTALSVSIWQTTIARAAAQRADASARFLEEILASASPYGSEYATTLLEAIDLAATKLEDRFSHQPLLESDVRQVIGNAYQSMGRIEEGSIQLEAALELRRTHGNPRDIAETLHGVGLIHWWRAEYDASERRFLEAIALIEEDESSESLALRAALHNDLGAMLLDPGRTEEAMRHLERSLELTDQNRTWDPEARRGILGNMLIGARRLGDRKLAEKTFTEASAISVELQKKVDPTHAALLNNYATVLEDQERWTEAGDLYRKAITIHEEALGPNNSFTVVPLMNYSKVTRLGGNPRAAISIAERAVTAARETWPEGHPLHGKALVALAYAHRDAGSTELAQGYADQALNIYQSAEAVNDAWLDEVTLLLESHTK